MFYEFVGLMVFCKKNFFIKWLGGVFVVSVMIMVVSKE